MKTALLITSLAAVALSAWLWSQHAQATTPGPCPQLRRLTGVGSTMWRRWLERGRRFAMSSLIGARSASQAAALVRRPVPCWRAIDSSSQSHN
jgi:hypothetical protein